MNPQKTSKHDTTRGEENALQPLQTAHVAISSRDREEHGRAVSPCATGKRSTPTAALDLMAASGGPPRRADLRAASTVASGFRVVVCGPARVAMAWPTNEAVKGREPVENRARSAVYLQRILDMECKSCGCSIHRQRDNFTESQLSDAVTIPLEVQVGELQQDKATKQAVSRGVCIIGQEKGGACASE